MKKEEVSVVAPTKTTGINTTIDAETYKCFGVETIESTDTIEEQIYNFVKSKNTVSFVEITEKFGEGNEQLTVAKNMVLWAELTEDAASAITNLIKSELLVMVDGSQMTYMIHGRMLNLPIAKRRPKNGYKTPHWVVAFLKVVN